MNTTDATTFNRSFHLEIYAVGETIEKALNALGKSLNWGEIEKISLQKDSKLRPCDWYVRFTADTTGMKAAGEYVTGGVIVTWWK